MSSPSEDISKSSKAPEEQDMVRVESLEMATEVIEVDAAYLSSGTFNKIFRGVLFQMILL